MHCPNCDVEYEEGITHCPACGAELAEDPVPTAKDTADWVNLVTVLKTGDVSLLLVAKSLLDAEGVPCFAEGEGVQESLGAGRIAASDMPLGPARLRVHPGDAERASELLASLQPEPESGGPDA